MSNLGYIYCLYNKRNNKKYIGETKNLKRRLYNHFGKLKRNTHSNKLLQKDYNKFGEEVFEVIIIERCNLASIEEKEKEYIDKFNTIEEGYNIVRGDISNLDKIEDHPFYGRSHSVKTKQKISNSLKGRERPDLRGRNNGMYGKTGEDNPFYGKKHSQETKEKMSKIRKNQNIKGENHPNSKLNKKEAKKIIEIYNNKNITQHELAKLYKVSQNTISSVINKKHWTFSGRSD